jgi:hypothetical protein
MWVKILRDTVANGGIVRVGDVIEQHDNTLILLKKAVACDAPKPVVRETVDEDASVGDVVKPKRKYRRTKVIK